MSTPPDGLPSGGFFILKLHRSPRVVAFMGAAFAHLPKEVMSYYVRKESIRLCMFLELGLVNGGGAVRIIFFWDIRFL